MSIKARITINQGVINRLGSIAKERMTEAVIELREETIRTLSQPGKGRTYTNYFFTDASGRLRVGRPRNKPHTASAPGDPPARDTSSLVKSVKWELEGNGNKIIGRVGTNLDLGPMLEYGTKKMAARPWLSVAARNSIGAIKSIFSREFM